MGGRGYKCLAHNPSLTIHLALPALSPLLCPRDRAIFTWFTMSLGNWCDSTYLSLQTCLIATALAKVTSSTSLIPCFSVSSVISFRRWGKQRSCKVHNSVINLIHILFNLEERPRLCMVFKTGGTHTWDEYGRVLGSGNFF